MSNGDAPPTDRSFKPIRHEKWAGAKPITEQEAEAKLQQEGYDSYRWYDVPGAGYPKHQHYHDECIWVLSGEITFSIHGKEYKLVPGDRLYLPGRTAHTASVPPTGGVTYLVGERRD